MCVSDESPEIPARWQRLMADGETAPLFHFNGTSVIINHDLSPSRINCAPSASHVRKRGCPECWFCPDYYRWTSARHLEMAFRCPTLSKRFLIISSITFLIAISFVF